MAGVANPTCIPMSARPGRDATEDCLAYRIVDISGSGTYVFIFTFKAG